MKDQGYLTTNKNQVAYSKKKKPLMSAEERKRQAKSLVSYKPGGNDIA